MKLILKESRHENFVYHNSPDPNIDLFVPKQIWRNEDWSESGNIKNPDFLEENVIFAIDKEKAIFYCLPRDTKRILILESKIFILPKDEKTRIENHSWTEYKFLKKDFEEVPTGEWIAKKPLKPVSKKKYFNPIDFIKNKKYKIKWVNNIYEEEERLKDSNIIFDSENL